MVVHAIMLHLYACYAISMYRDVPWNGSKVSAEKQVLLLPSCLDSGTLPETLRESEAGGCDSFASKDVSTRRNMLEAWLTAGEGEVMSSSLVARSMTIASSSSSSS